MSTKQSPIKRTQTKNSSTELIGELALTSLFNSIDISGSGSITCDQFWAELAKGGILQDDPRLQKISEAFDRITRTKGKGCKVTLYEFKKTVTQHVIVKKTLTGDLVIPDFQSFTHEITQIFNATKGNKGGKVADYIPQLARVNAEQYAVSICTIDGQRFSFGDYRKRFCLQSICKPINYCIAHEELDEETVHNHIGREPSGRSFNEMALNNDLLPHNPLINSGAIMCSSLIQRDLNVADRFEHVLKTWTDLSGGVNPTFNNSVYLSERQTADRNFALAYFMRENKAFPPKTDIIETLEFYFQCCSIEATSTSVAAVAATLANGGLNPLTGTKVFNSSTVKNCLSLMNSCGMYDFSGEFAFKIGFPAKSGVSGALLVVIPNVMGICLWSPRLDELGNSVRGVEFCKTLGEKYNFHNYDILVNNSTKKDPRKKRYESKIDSVMALIWAASAGDMDELQRLNAMGADLNAADYDGRTAMHLAAAEGQFEVVKYFINKDVNLSPKDRWGGTPLKDARKGKHLKVAEILERKGAR